MVMRYGSCDNRSDMCFCDTSPRFHRTAALLELRVFRQRRLAGVAVDMNSNHHHARHHCLTSTNHITNN
jgi:hypothetical protein